MAVSRLIQYRLRVADGLAVNYLLVGSDNCSLPVHLKIPNQDSNERAMPNALRGNANQLHRCPHIRRRNYSTQASIPICREAWVAVHWFLNQKRSSPAFWKRTCFSREPISSAHVDPFPAFLTLICPRNGLGTFWSKQMEAARDKGGKDTHNQRPNTDIHGCHPH